MNLQTHHSARDTIEQSALLLTEGTVLISERNSLMLHSTHHLKVGFLFLIFSFLFSARASARAWIRPEVGIGVISARTSSAITQIGGRFLLEAGDNKSYGLEISRFKSSTVGSFFAGGIMLEQRLWNWFSMSIGTIGYFNYKSAEKTANYPGLSTNLGWEPALETWRPFITYRSDFIFTAGGPDLIHGLSVGYGFHF
jgi:hypothetical protein